MSQPYIDSTAMLSDIMSVCATVVLLRASSSQEVLVGTNRAREAKEIRGRKRYTACLW